MTGGRVESSAWTPGLRASMSRPPAQTTSTDTRAWSATKARVLAYCEQELPRQGIAYGRLNVIPSSRPDYDALVEIWNGREARVVGVRLPAETIIAAAA